VSEPRGIEERIKWMLDHPPGVVGMCARETWQAIGGDQSPPNPPAWGAAEANDVYSKMINSGRYFSTLPIPRGAYIAWRYGEHGHLALSYGDNKIVTTDPSGQPGGTGIEDLSYPHQWGASSGARIWSDEYNGVRFDVGDEEDMPSAEQIADAVWASKTEDPSTGDEVSMRELVKRTRTVATQGRDAAREAAANTSE
jgi:hypothetical protein